MKSKLLVQRKGCSVPCERGASILELSIILGLFIVVMLPAFWLLIDKYSKEDLTQNIQNAFISLQTEEVHFATLDLTAIQSPREECLLAKLQSIAKGLVDMTEESNFCSVLMVKGVGPAQVYDNGSTEFSRDENGNNCGPPPQDLLDEFEAGTDPDLRNGFEFCAGSWWMDDESFYDLHSCPNGSEVPRGAGAGLGGSNCNI